MSQEIDILALGNAIVDVIARVEEDFLLAQSVAKGSMTLIDEAQAERLYAAMGPATIVSGGSAANTVVGAASFGARCAFVGCVRKDPVGEVFARDIVKAGVAYATPAASEGPATARSFILVTPDGERTMNTYLGACQNLSPREVDPAQVARARITYLEGYLWDPPAAKAAFRKAAELAHAAGREVALTLSDTFCVDRYRDEFRELLSAVDLIFANEYELKSLYEAPDFSSALSALRKEARRAVITRAEKGAVIVEGDLTLEIPAAPITALVDATGAGDAYAAGFLFAYGAGMGYEKAGHLGVLAASHVIQKIGARPAVPLKDLARQAGLM